MKICENCGAHLDSGERCDCEVTAILADPETQNTMKRVKTMPKEVQVNLAMAIKMFETLCEINAAG